MRKPFRVRWIVTALAVWVVAGSTWFFLRVPGFVIRQYLLYYDPRPRNPLDFCSVSSRESSAISSLIDIHVAEEQYYHEFGAYGTFPQLMAVAPPYLPPWGARGERDNYSLTIRVNGPPHPSFQAHARPIWKTPYVRRSFFVDSTGVIRYHLSRAATSGDSPIE